MDSLGKAMKPESYMFFLLFLICVLEAARGYTESGCEGDVMRAWCSTNHDEWLRIDDAFWGRLSATRCADQNADSTTCYYSDFLNNTRRVCEGRKDCKISALWRSLGDPCPGTSKYANVTYRCQSCSDNDGVTSCESRKAAGECESDRDVMMDNCFATCSRCREFNTSSCDNIHGKETFNTINRECDIWAFMGECYSNPDWMLVNCKESCKACSTTTKTTARGCEAEYIDIACDTPSFIFVDEVKYGRFDTSFCNADGNVTADDLCPASQVALERVRRACEGRSYCSVYVTNPALDPNDPCPGIPKQASVSYTCQLCENSLTDSECQQRVGQLQCIFNRDYMMENCFAECSGCKDAVCGNDATEERDCDYWSMQGECENNPGFMHYRCAQSCLTCDCKNEADDSNCNAWANRGECEANPGWMPYHCAKACGTCYECLNSFGDDLRCENWANSGECSANPFWMLYRCAHACYACGDKVGPFSKKVCESTTTRLHCDNAEQKIHLTEIFFGRRNNDTCAHASYVSGLTCNAPAERYSAVESVCNGRTECWIYPVNGLFTDPCAGVTKQLDVEFFCQDCSNKLDDAECDSRKSSGECESNASSMLDDCFQACTGCRLTECSNTDVDADCDYWAMIGECEKNPDYMLQRCKKSCRQDCPQS